MLELHKIAESFVVSLHCTSFKDGKFFFSAFLLKQLV